jgi:hypothetical protein
MRLLIAALVASSLSLASSVALAEGPDAAPPPAAAETKAPATSTWYGYQTLATDAVAGLLAIPALTSSSSATQQGFGVGTAVMYGVGAPLVHFSHGRVGAGFADLGIRAAAPLLGALVGFAAGGGGFASIGGAVEGFGVGMGGAVAVDAALLAYDPASTDAPAAPAPVRPAAKAATLEPAVAVTPERTGGTRATVGVLGTF